MEDTGWVLGAWYTHNSHIWRNGQQVVSITPEGGAFITQFSNKTRHTPYPYRSQLYTRISGSLPIGVRPGSAIPDVSGDYPAELMPKLVETARRIAASGSCNKIWCTDCPSSNSFHGYKSECSKRSGGNIDDINPAWFRAFVERYGNKTPLSDPSVINYTIQGGDIDLTKIMARNVMIFRRFYSSPHPESATARRKRMLHAR